MLQPKSRRGQSVIETALLLPWVVFLFVGALDWGFYMYTLISVQGAARIAVLYTSSSAANAADSATACAYALNQLKTVPVSGTFPTSCGASPIQVTVAKPADPYDSGKFSSKVTVTFQTIPLIPIPGILRGSMAITRVAQMKVKN